MIVLFEIKVQGELLGLCAYNTVVDLWQEALYKDRLSFQESKPLGARTCADDEGHKVDHVEVTAGESDVPEAQLMWCPSCLCLVSPPFDGYTYHEYGCDLSSTCSCDVV